MCVGEGGVGGDRRLHTVKKGRGMLPEPGTPTLFQT